MSNENPADSGAGSPSDKGERTTDSVVAEFARKTSKLAEENAALSQKLDQLTALIQQQRTGGNSSAQATGDDEANLEELIYKDPKAYAKAVEARAVRKADEMINSRLQTQNEAQSVLAQLAADYPELNDSSSELTKKAVSIYNSLPANQRSNPLAYKIAVRDAAADMGVLVKSKRKQSNSDDFAMDSGSGGSSSRPQSKGSEKVDNRSLAFAELLGLNVNDEKVVKRLQERSKRKNWGNWS